MSLTASRDSVRNPKIDITIRVFAGEQRQTSDDGRFRPEHIGGKFTGRSPADLQLAGPAAVPFVT
jgi:hypothetical protein